MHFIIDPIAGFWENLFSGMSIQGPSIDPVYMAWLTLIGGIISIIMFIDWLRKLFQGK